MHLHSALLLLAASCVRPVPPESAAKAVFEWPPARRSDVVDTYHGVQVADPYRWLEDPDSPETRAWIDAQNALTRSVLSDVAPLRDAIRARLDRLWDFEQSGIPWKEGGRYFYQHNPGTANQSLLYWTEGVDGEPRLLLDPNGLSADGTVALAGYAPSRDGRLLAYGLSDGGSDWTTWRVREVDTGRDLEDRLAWIKFSGAAWTRDGQGFFYARYPEPEATLRSVSKDQSLWYHAVGTAQEADVLVYRRSDRPEWGFSPVVSEDGRWLVVHIWESTEERNRVYVDDLGVPGWNLVPVLDDFDASWSFLGNEGTRFWFQTNLDAPRSRVVSLDVTRPAERTEVIPESIDALQGVSLVGGRFVAVYLHDVTTLVRVFERDGRPAGTVPLPGLGSAGGFGGRADDPETFFSFTSFAEPGSVWRYDVATGAVAPWRRPTLAFDPAAYVSEQVFVPSRDGTRIPMFVVHRRDVVPDGDVPTLLYGYGGFNASLTPSFRVTGLQWMEMGGLYAVANLRGGGEFGETWHQAGILDRKQNAFDDFVAAAEWLQASGWTRRDRLAIQGGSNGGLLVGACLVQRPDLFGAALPAVGVMDMLRYHRFTIGWAWASDYGTSDDPALFRTLLAYSPLHNVTPGTAYPPTLLTTGDHDDRVVPAHSFKFAAALQAAQAGPAPILIRIETRAGHGAGKPRAMRLDEAADVWAFAARSLGWTPEVPAAGS